MRGWLDVRCIWMVALAAAGTAVSARAQTQGPERVWTEDERRELVSGLERTRDLLLGETANLTAEQWRFRESPDRWSIAEVVEHLGLQEDMYFREVYLVSQMPERPERRSRVQGKDARIAAYATDPERGTAGWFLQPLGRWASGEAAASSFARSRERMTEFVRGTAEDLRLHFTFRDYDDDLWSERDLHQLLLTTVAHTERHLHQIRRIKAHPAYPRTAGEPEQAAVLRVIEGESAAFWDKDFDRWASHWAHVPHARIMGWWQAGGISVTEGWENIGRGMRQVMQENPTPNATARLVRRDNVSVRIVGDMALVTFDQHGLDTGDARMDMPGRSRESRVLEKQDGKWKIVYAGWLLEGEPPGE